MFINLFVTQMISHLKDLTLRSELSRSTCAHCCPQNLQCHLTVTSDKEPVTQVSLQNSGLHSIKTVNKST